MFGGGNLNESILSLSDANFTLLLPKNGPNKQNDHFLLACP